MKTKSLWSDYLVRTKEQLANDLDVDVLIIGGGITGLSVAYSMIESGKSVVVVERDVIGSGVTSKSTAKVTFLQQDLLTKIATYHGMEVASLYLKSQIDAVEMVKKIIDDNNIDCDFEQSKSFLYASNSSNYSKIDKTKEILKTASVEVHDVSLLPDKTKGYGIEVDNTYCFNVVKYLNELGNICEAKGIKIYEKTKIISISKLNNYYLARTKDNMITAKYIVLALHYPYFIFPFLFPAKATLEKSYIKCFPVTTNLTFNAINVDQPEKSIRYYTNSKHNETNYKIILTASHNITSKNNEYKNFEMLEQFEGDNVSYMWSNIDIYPADYLPFIGSIESNMYLATGYNAWGMTNSIVAGKLISDLINQRNNKYAKLFAPRRGLNLGKVIRYPYILCNNIYSFFKTKIYYNKSWYNSALKFYNDGGKKVAEYMDKSGTKHLVYPICPHMKCTLIFNEVELTWDCPCHGSRFDIDGHVLHGPANYDISYKNSQ